MTSQSNRHKAGRKVKVKTKTSPKKKLVYIQGNPTRVKRKVSYTVKKMKPFTAAIYKMDGSLSHYVDVRTGNTRNRWWTKARVPGTVRKSRMPGGSGFRNNWETSDA